MTGTSTNWFLFVGQLGYYYDNDLASNYIRRRVYNAVTGRFSSRDPIAFSGGSTNLYLYVGNSPSRFTDPSGMLLLRPPIVARPGPLVTVQLCVVFFYLGYCIGEGLSPISVQLAEQICSGPTVIPPPPANLELPRSKFKCCLFTCWNPAGAISSDEYTAPDDEDCSPGYSSTPPDPPLTCIHTGTLTGPCPTVH